MNSKRTRYLRKIAKTIADRDPHKDPNFVATLRDRIYRKLKKHWNRERCLPEWAL